MAVLLAAGVVLGSASADPQMTTREYFSVMDERYEEFINARPWEVTTSGTGFKPYQRFKYFFEPRLSEDGNMRPGARWKAYEQLQGIVEEKGRTGETWFTLGPVNVAGRCLAIEVHPDNSNIVYAGFASSGLWKTEDAGATWTPLGDQLPTLAIGCLEIHPTDPDIIWMGTGEGWGNVDAVHGVGLLKSTDGGDSWETTGYDYEMNQGRDVYELEYIPTTGTLLLGADNGLWRSTDGGATFDQIMPYGHWKDVELKKGSTDMIFACAHGMADAGFYRSTDDGLTWQRTTSGVPTVGLGNMRFGLTDADPDRIYWAISSGGGTMMGIWRSTDGGDSFSQIYYPGQNHYGQQGWYNLTITADPTDPNRVFSGGVYFYFSSDGGSSFSHIAQNVHVDHHATIWDPNDPSIFWVGTDGGVYRSTNSGTSYQNKNLGLVTMQFYAMGHSISLPTRALGGTQDNGTWIFNNSDYWGQILGGDGFFCEVDWSDEDYVYAELYYGDHFRSSNGGPGMQPINSGITENGPWSTPTHLDYGNPSILYTAHNSIVFKTTNKGNYWFPITTEPIYGSGTSIHQCRSDVDNLVVTSKLKVWVSTDRGDTWDDRTGGLSSAGTFSDSHMHPNDPNTIVVTLSTYSSSINQVFKTTDQGQTWFPIDAGLPDVPVNTVEIDPLNPDWYFIGTDNAVYVSFNAGGSWTPMNVGLPHVVMADLKLHPDARFLRVATHGRGMWEVDISELSPSSGVDEAGLPEVKPLTLRVLGSPAAESVVLRYGLRRPGEMHLAIYDVGGREVAKVYDGYARAKIDNATVDLSRLS
ncbi:MAG: hypothetical protein GF355_09465, partial [Candidatus Eisenbacteria bacterium]|nr:hypothetical protein [Candidatus Eisenbacteria bacterium]